MNILKLIAHIANSTNHIRDGRFGSILQGAGHYAGLCDIGHGMALALHCDGVGTKILVADIIGQYNSIGIDCVAMNCNDLICLGAKPFAFLDYIAISKPNHEIIEGILQGIKVGCMEAHMALVGGETATHSDHFFDEKSLDLAGFGVGIVKKSEIITGNAIRPGDIVIGLESSGIHSNGLTVARECLFKRLKLAPNDIFPGDPLERTVAENLLTPTKIYVDPILGLLREFGSDVVHGLAHITGGAFTKLTRLTSFGFKLDNLPEPPHIFDVIKENSNLSNSDMYHIFNMGIGFCVVISPKRVEDVCSWFSDHNIPHHIIGKVVREPGVFL